MIRRTSWQGFQHRYSGGELNRRFTQIMMISHKNFLQTFIISGSESLSFICINHNKLRRIKP
ncbi:MAG: hypothetical protein DRI57_33440 [Deltaproteobacteria bacterium]|nr:MAG: hypothetical protein DRI57_33440 [Deltaproteobacteria bacterium]